MKYYLFSQPVNSRWRKGIIKNTISGTIINVVTNVCNGSGVIRANTSPNATNKIVIVG
ncbi:MAG TPA: hypothetical protein VEW65_04170 [Chryseolinea sp.]|nr:hypothetical protein [Chryseolinea sp.]